MCPGLQPPPGPENEQGYTACDVCAHVSRCLRSWISVSRRVCTSAYCQPKFASEVYSVVSPCPQRRMFTLRENSRRCTCPQNNDNANLLGAFGTNTIGGSDICQSNQSQPRGEHQRPIVHPIEPSMSHNQKPVSGTAYATPPYLYHTS
ncbi:hypothetical protein SNOG_11154 [Parastagonospora nodorum SN15]|uniref:Uncharacterized protein n=1 Tax=Phaeosphaeria nodorum (strain SN15 / ATCC MYA-4574 / FGSC 10173) TaxID=321614 RepID=Q0UAR0_PHANO|nr:hypothetical protein SNOG_11154 [Parastagonospora nodorum SN15]EAT81653.1 hypothetical protein SNOG_11154 [Parastagonospora nodorum SN15]